MTAVPFIGQRLGPTCASLVVLALASQSAFAHSGPVETIARLTQQLDANGASVSLLVQRAIEYRTLNEFDAAKRDLEHALDIDPTYMMALRELAKVEFCAGEIDASIRAVDEALMQTNGAPSRFGLFALRSDIHRAANRNNEALDDIARALESDRPEVDWYLQRSRLQWTTGAADQRVLDLRDAATQNASIVIQYELTDALIDSGEYAESLERVEAELLKCRDCSSWRIRRARIYQGLGNADAAKADLETAIADLTAQLNERRNSPIDVTVIVERATAYALLGNTARARRGLRFARALQADEWLTAPLVRRIKERHKSTTASVV